MLLGSRAQFMDLIDFVAAHRLQPVLSGVYDGLGMPGDRQFTGANISGSRLFTCLNNRRDPRCLSGTSRQIDGDNGLVARLIVAEIPGGFSRQRHQCRGAAVSYRSGPGKDGPPTLFASLMARLDRLRPGKDITQIGSAIGREFTYELLAAIATKPESELRSALEQLVGAGLIFARGTLPEATYLFKRALVRDVATGRCCTARPGAACPYRRCP